MNLAWLLKKNLYHPVLAQFNRLRGVQLERADQTAWREEAQRGELTFHKNNTWRDSPAFMRDTIALFESFGFGRGDYAGRRVVDLGAGSKLRAKFFENAEWIAIEPLAEACLADIGWCDLDDAAAVYSQPAEELLPELVDTTDLLFSINVLDHCYDFEAIMANVYAYLKPTSGLAFLSFDCHFVTDRMHPLILTDEICVPLFERLGFTIERKSKGFTGKFREATGSDTYGHGKYCLNYWLRKN